MHLVTCTLCRCLAASPQQAQQAAALAILAQCWQLYLPPEASPQLLQLSRRSKLKQQHAAPTKPHLQSAHAHAESAANDAPDSQIRDGHIAGSDRKLQAPASGLGDEASSVVLDVRADAGFWGLLRACLVTHLVCTGPEARLHTFCHLLSSCRTLATNCVSDSATFRTVWKQS